MYSFEFVRELHQLKILILNKLYGNMGENQTVKYYMYNNISTFFRNVSNFFVEAFFATIGLPKTIKNFVIRAKMFVHDQFLKFVNIVDTNISLGKYHLECGHINDAIIRFRIAQFFFDKENSEINYWLGWCYFIKGKYEKASICLKGANDFDKIKLGNFIEQCDTLEEVPKDIWEQLSEITLFEENTKYSASDIYNKNINLPLEFVNFFLYSVQELPAKSRILDYGSGSGLVGSYLDYKIDKEYKITALESKEVCLKYAKTLRGERGFVYDQTQNASLYGPLKSLKDKKYDIFFCFDSLRFTKKLHHYFKAFHNSLDRSGYLAIMLPSSQATHWNKKMKSYSYNTNEVLEQIKLAKFDIVDIKELSLNRQNKYLFVVAQKK